MTVRLSGRRAEWSQVRDEELLGLTCLWQDLDGFHVEPTPSAPPLTSILWAWGTDRLARVRLDGTTAFVAICPADTPGVRAIGWDPNDGRVHAFRPAPGCPGLDRLVLDEVFIDGEATRGGVTFLRAVGNVG